MSEQIGMNKYIKQAKSGDLPCLKSINHIVMQDQKSRTNYEYLDMMSDIHKILLKSFVCLQKHLKLSKWQSNNTASLTKIVEKMNG